MIVHEALHTVAAGFHRLVPGDDFAFEEMARSVLSYQEAHNSIYGRYCKYQKYLPVSAFKHAPVTTFPPSESEALFESSRTGRTVPSRHYVYALEVYERSVLTHFEQVFGSGPFTLLAHLPHYAEQGSRSSLLYMVDLLMRTYGDEKSGFFLEDLSLFHQALSSDRPQNHPFLLFGAAFGLLDLIEKDSFLLPEGARVIETGGMKTYRRAIRRAELHTRLAKGFSLPEAQVWSEYGMCELMSQCYTRGAGLFFAPPWMRFAILDPEDPTRICEEGEAGALAVMDLANLYSASALLTEDLAVRRGEGFEVLGRLTDAELRGCNFLVSRS